MSGPLARRSTVRSRSKKAAVWPTRPGYRSVRDGPRPRPHPVTAAGSRGRPNFTGMEFRQLAAILALAEHGTFSAAADALGTVQSNVSTHIARLERELGTPLFDRSRGTLTEEGQAVVARAQRVVAELDALVSDVAAVRNVVTGTVRLGIIGTTARWLAPKVPMI